MLDSSKGQHCQAFSSPYFLQTLAMEQASDQDSPLVLTIPPEIMEVISRRNLSIIELSPYITEGIEEALKVSSRFAREQDG